MSILIQQDNSTIITCSKDKSIKATDTLSQTTIKESLEKYSPHMDIITHMALTSDERYLFSSDKTGRVVCWFVQDWVPICNFSADIDNFQIDRLTLGLDSSMLMAQSKEGGLIYWQI